MQLEIGKSDFAISLSFNPHPLRRAGATLRWSYLNQSPCVVSILTRSEERVQLGYGLVVAKLRQVSILTRSEERVQLLLAEGRSS